MTVHCGPVDFNSGEPLLTQRGQDELARSLPFTRMRQGGEHYLIPRFGWMPAGKGTKCLTWPNLKQYARRLLQQSRESIRKADTTAKMLNPIVRIDRFLRRDPRSRNVGHKGNLRRVHPDALQEFEELCSNWIHHA